MHEVHKPSIETRGFFIEGKFDQYQKNIPYFAWSQAFKGFVNLLLTENENSLQNHPLSIFIDDWQWADSASLEILKNLLIDQDIRYLFWIFLIWSPRK